ncbi:hypothetical protein ACFQZM_16605 [Actinomadura fibrosa]|uniref:Uncharacterized protein n=2 Tax=Actinomadura fibrosa TaxID=111802 RepID=A0ABW2XI96_9ACTN
MYGAFRRDMARLEAAGGVDGAVGSRGVRNGWETFRLHWLAQRAAEERALWTVMRGRVPGAGPRPPLVDAMEFLGLRLVPLFDTVDTALERGDGHVFAWCARELPEAVATLLDYTEAKALPLVHELLTPYEWGTFEVEFRREIGFRGLRDFLPWLLDGASEDTSRAVLAMLPPPVRFAYRTRWLRRHERRDLWTVRPGR